MAVCIVPRFAIFYCQVFIFSSFSQIAYFYVKVIFTTVQNCRFCCHIVAYLGYGRHGTCQGRHFDGGAKIKIFIYSFLNLYFAPHARDVTRLDGARDNK